MNEKEMILEAMKKAGEPLNAGKVAELTGLDRKVVDKAFTELKKDGSIVSPVRCKWEPAAKEKPGSQCKTPGRLAGGFAVCQVCVRMFRMLPSSSSFRNTFTIRGSNWVPEPRRISCRAVSRSMGSL